MPAACTWIGERKLCSSMFPPGPAGAWINFKCFACSALIVSAEPESGFMCPHSLHMDTAAPFCIFCAFDLCCPNNCCFVDFMLFLLLLCKINRQNKQRTIHERPENYFCVCYFVLGRWFVGWFMRPKIVFDFESKMCTTIRTTWTEERDTVGEK